MELVGQRDSKNQCGRPEPDSPALPNVATKGSPRQNPQYEILENVSRLAADRVNNVQLFRGGGRKKKPQYRDNESRRPGVGE